MKPQKPQDLLDTWGCCGQKLKYREEPQKNWSCVQLQQIRYLDHVENQRSCVEVVKQWTNCKRGIEQQARKDFEDERAHVVQLTA